jgi:hypothetical protein
MHLRVAGLTVLTVVAGLVIGDVSLAEGENPFAPPLDASNPMSLANPGQAARIKKLQDAGRALQSPENRAARLASRTRFENLASADALSLARSRFPDHLVAGVFDGSDPVDGIDVTRQAGANASIGVDDHGRKVLVHSTVPMRTTTTSASGERQAMTVDLSLQRRGDWYAPTVGVEPLRIPARAGGEVALAAADVTLRLADATDRTAQVKSDRVFYAAVQTDTDALVFPTPTGAEFSLQLRSARSPERFVLDVDMPDGATLRKATSEHPIPNDPPQSLEILGKDGPLAYISPPLTTDSDGRLVKTSMSTDGQHVILQVDHHGQDLRYPLLADPEIAINGSNVNAWAGWIWGEVRNDPGFTGHFGQAIGCPYYCGGLYQSYPTNTVMANGSYASWAYRAPAGTFLTQAVFGTTKHTPMSNGAGNITYSSMGMMNGTYTAWETATDSYANLAHPFQTNAAESGRFSHYCTSPCDGRHGSNQNFALYNLLVYNPFGTPTNSGGSKGYSTMDYAWTVIADTNRPTMTLPVDTPWFNDHGDEQTTMLTAHDDGLGIASIYTSVNDAAATEIHSKAGTADCTGDPYASPCPRDIIPYAWKYTLHEGDNTLAYTARDPAGNWVADVTPPIIHAKVDRTAPPAPILGFDTPSENTAQASWDEVLDPAAPDGTRSGIAEYRVRSRVNGGAFTGWVSYPATARESVETAPYATGTTVEFEVMAVDTAANASATSSADATIEGDGPEVTTAGPVADANGGYVAAAPTSLTALGDDASGVLRFLLKSGAGTTLAQSDVNCPAGVCPSETSGLLNVDLSSYPEGPVSFALSALDKFFNETSNEVINLVVDRTAPPPPTSVRQIAATSTTATLAWNETGDPLISPDVPGSGPAPVRYRVTHLLGTPGPWQSSDTGIAEIPATTAEVLTVETQSFDEVGNASAVTSTIITVLPDILLGDLDPSGQRSAELRESQTSPPTLSVADQTEYGYEADFDPNSTPRDTTVGEEGTLQPGTETAQPCGLYYRDAFNDSVPANVRAFKQLRTAVETRLFLQCPTPSGQVLPTNKVELKLSIAYRIGGDQYRALGSQTTRTLNNAHVNDDIDIKPIRRFCVPAAAGTRSYLVIGSIKYLRDNGPDTPRYRIAVHQADARQIVCPNFDTRRKREAAAFTLLRRTSPDPSDTRDRSPSAWLRDALGTEPAKPQSRKGPGLVKNAWDAHHIVPHSDQPALDQQALLFRCAVHPNENVNGIYLRGPGLRKTVAGRTTRAYKDLKALDPALAARGYHGNTRTPAYYSQLAAKVPPSDAPELCSGNQSVMVRTDLVLAYSQLVRSTFGHEPASEKP